MQCLVQHEQRNLAGNSLSGGAVSGDEIRTLHEGWNLRRGRGSSFAIAYVQAMDWCNTDSREPADALCSRGMRTRFFDAGRRYRVVLSDFGILPSGPVARRSLE